MASLTVVSGDAFGRVYPVEEPVCRLGRQLDCHIWDLFIGLLEVSRHHAEIEKTAAGFVLRDLNSRHGTRINGERISVPTRLQQGDRIGICGIKLSFSEAAGDQAIALGEAATDATCFVEDADSSSVQSKIDVALARCEGSESVAGPPDARLHAMIEMLRGLGQSLDMHHVLDHVLTALLQVFPGAERAFVGVRREDGEDLVPIAAKYRRLDRKEPIRVCRAIVDEVMHERRGIRLIDALREPPFRSSESVRHQHIRSVICAPLLDAQGVALGIVQVDTAERQCHFGHGDLEILVAVARLIAALLQTAHLHKLILERQAIERDLALAQEVQASLLPEGKPEFEGYDFFPFYRPARRVGGDYYDYIPLADGRLAIVMADAAGKGVPAALLMMRLSGMLRTSLMREPPADAMTYVNRWLASGDFAGRFVTMVLVVLDRASEEIAVVNAGHFEPLLRHANGTIEPLGDEAKGLPLGVNYDEVYPEFSAELRPGECITLFTDGITDALNEAGSAYRVTRLERLLQAEFRGIYELGNRIIEDVLQYVGGCEQNDDMSLVCFCRLP